MSFKGRSPSSGRDWRVILRKGHKLKSVVVKAHNRDEAIAMARKKVSPAWSDGRVYDEGWL